jgi:hypothetical protein
LTLLFGIDFMIEHGVISPADPSDKVPARSVVHQNLTRINWARFAERTIYK